LKLCSRIPQGSVTNLLTFHCRFQFSLKHPRRFNMFRFFRFFAGAAIAATLLAVPFMISSAVVSTNTVSVIVEFRDDPGAVYAAKLKRSGALPSSDQIQAYRNNLSAAQDQFLNALKSSGINFQLQTIAVKNPAGNVAGNVALRYSLVYNGMALTVPEAAV